MVSFSLMSRYKFQFQTLLLRLVLVQRPHKRPGNKRNIIHMSIEAKLVTIISGLLLVANGLYSSDANNRPAFTRNPFTIACNLHG